MRTRFAVIMLLAFATPGFAQIISPGPGDGESECANVFVTSVNRSKVCPGQSLEFAFGGTADAEHGFVMYETFGSYGKTFVPDHLDPAAYERFVPPLAPLAGTPNPGLSPGGLDPGVCKGVAGLAFSEPMRRIDVGKRFEMGGAIFPKAVVADIQASIDALLALREVAEILFESVRQQMIDLEAASQTPILEAIEGIRASHVTFEDLLKAALGRGASEVELDRVVEIEELSARVLRLAGDAGELAFRIEALQVRQALLEEIRGIREAIDDAIHAIIEGGISPSFARSDVFEALLTAAPLRFLPQGGIDENAVEYTTFIVPQWEAADVIVFSLAEVSSEPGHSLNRPKQPSVNLPDYFIQGSSVFSGTSGTLTLRSFDYGGFGKVDCLVFLDDAVCLAREWATGAPQTRVPRDQNPQNHIADGWGGEGASVTFDFEPFPPTPAMPSNSLHAGGNTGDGHTLYEEYRGFIVRARHIRTFPNSIKDLFVWDRSELLEQSNYRLASKIYVHRILSVDEVAPTADGLYPRIDSNAGTFHTNDQYAIALKRGRLRKDQYGTTDTRFNFFPLQKGDQPHNVMQVRVDLRRMEDTEREWYQNAAGDWLDLIAGAGGPQAVEEWLRDHSRFEPWKRQVITHELGHATDVDHHFKTDEAGKEAENADGGVEDCAMRYSFVDLMNAKSMFEYHGVVIGSRRFCDEQDFCKRQINVRD